MFHRILSYTVLNNLVVLFVVSVMLKNFILIKLIKHLMIVTENINIG